MTTQLKSAMNAIRTIVSAALLGCAATLAAYAQAPATTTAEAAATDAMTRAEVRKVDQEHRKITLKHDAIKNLDMPPMTMVFQVRDPALLDKVHVGDKVLFAVASDAGKLIVTRIQPTK
jgi:Cu(I)/Ag(I) efflux system periplasmic protein CusF